MAIQEALISNTRPILSAMPANIRRGKSSGAEAKQLIIQVLIDIRVHGPGVVNLKEISQLFATLVIALANAMHTARVWPSV